MHNKTDQEPTYLNANIEPRDRAEDLLSRMTLREKVAQLRAFSLLGSVVELEGVAETKGTAAEALANGIGNLETVIDSRSPVESAQTVNEIQRFLKEKTRLGIPGLVSGECLHGHSGRNSTVLPSPIAMACSWNTSLIHACFDMAAREARARGVHEAFAPVLDLGRDPRWGRIEETFGEDTCLVSALGLAAVTGLQGSNNGEIDDEHVICVPKHFAGYGQVAGGRNFASTTMDPRTFDDEILPPWKAAVQEGGIRGLMASHCEVDGVPAHGNRKLLTKLLRDDWSFDGIVVSDYSDVSRLATFQKVVETRQQAATTALHAGVDLDLPSGETFALLEQAADDDPEILADIDKSVRRILRLKFELGLFENPYVEIERTKTVVGNATHLDLANKLADESIVLLKNADELLPLNRDHLTRMAVIGPNAKSREVGNYVAGNDNAVCILKGVEDAVPSHISVTYEEGCCIIDGDYKPNVEGYKHVPLKDELPRIESAVELAAVSDVAVVCVGGRQRTSVESYFSPRMKGDRATLGLLGNQEELVLRVIATGTPTIVVLMGGKPYCIPEIYNKASAVLSTFYLGQQNGHAVARALFGESNPSGKLSITVPRSVGQLPVYYSQKAISFYKSYLDEESGPLYPFGYGLSYTKFRYSKLKIDKPAYSRDETISLDLVVENTGKRAGAEIVQLYMRDCVASLARPDKLLIGFEKVQLEAGEAKNVRFEIIPDRDLSFTGTEMTRVVEPGRFEVMIGSSSADIHLTDEFTIK